MYGVIKDDKGEFKFGPHQITKIDKELDGDKGKYIWRKEFSNTKISIVPLNRPDDYHFTMEVSSEGKIVLSWKGINGESHPSEQEFRKCQLMLRAWRDKINGAISNNSSSLEEAEANRKVFESLASEDDINAVNNKTLKDKAHEYLRILYIKSKNNYRRGYSHKENSTACNLSKSNSQNVLSYLRDKGLIDTRSGYGDSVIITAKGIDFFSELDENITSIPAKNYMNTQISVSDKFKELDELARLYKAELSKGQSAKVNSHEFIDIFSKWFLEARNIFLKYYDESNLNYSEFANTKIGGNGYYQSSQFSTLEPIYQILKNEIILGLNNSVKSSDTIITNEFFVIHGHNEKIKFEVARFIESEIEKKAIILHEMPNKGKTIIEKFENYSNVDFAIALWTSDDVGSSKDVDEFKARARQNVIFETGYFIGKLGRSRVIVLYENDIEIPSDYNGVIYISLSGN